MALKCSEKTYMKFPKIAFTSLILHTINIFQRNSLFVFASSHCSMERIMCSLSNDCSNPNHVGTMVRYQMHNVVQRWGNLSTNDAKWILWNEDFKFFKEYFCIHCFVSICYVRTISNHAKPIGFFSFHFFSASTLHLANVIANRSAAVNGVKTVSLFRFLATKNPCLVPSIVQIAISIGKFIRLDVRQRAYVFAYMYRIFILIIFNQKQRRKCCVFLSKSYQGCL